MEGIQGNVQEVVPLYAWIQDGGNFQQIFAHRKYLVLFVTVLFLPSAYSNGEIGNRLLQFVQFRLIKYVMKLSNVI
jgi:hypothetical protein